jgi:hypothetical protein
MYIWILIILLMGQVVCAEELPVFQHISDLYHPSVTDFRQIQGALSHNPRPELKRLDDKENVLRKFKIIGDLPQEVPRIYQRDVNVEPGVKENCVICYASYNENYPKGCKRLFLHVLLSNFKGHVDCRIGGWPDLEGGSLPLAPVPFAFKACFFKEMKRAGYKRVLWMDASIVPLVSLNQIFKIIEEKGYFIQKNCHVLHPPFMTEELAEIFGLPFEEACQLRSCSAAIFGVDFTNDKVSQLIDAWYRAAAHPLAFYSPRSDQTALSVLLHQFGLTNWMPESILVSRGEYRKEALFLMEREYVKTD